MENNTEKNSGGGVIGAILIIIVILAGGWYFFNERVSKIQSQKETATSTVVNSSDLSTSTEVKDIQADLGKIDIKVLDQQ